MAVKRKHAPAKKAKGKSNRGTGAAHYKVKGRRATAKQRDTINGVLEQCESDNAGKRVMIAAVMCITQESGAGELAGVMTGNDDVGIFQQGRNWITVEGSKDPHRSTHAFLITGPTSWKKVHHGVKNAPGNLSVAIHQVQNNADPNAYAPWEKEATRTVETWLGAGGGEGYAYRLKRYVFTRGEKHGDREDSWEAADRLVQEVGAYRWAAGNVFYAVSGDELRRGAPALVIHGDEGWLRRDPAWSWASRRPVGEMTLEVLMDHWDVMPGAMVELHRDLGVMSGRWMVQNVSGPSLDSPEGTVALRRPTRLKAEPAPEVQEISRDAGDFSGPGGELRDICKMISDHRSSYVYGGGHGPPVKNLHASSHMDCSSSTSFALYKAGFFDGNKPALVSGGFASSWGRPGKGDEFTVWAHSGHVWIEFHDGARFDTSQHGGKSGPAFTTVKRSHAGFTPRHAKGH